MSTSKTEEDLANVQASLKSIDNWFDQMAAPVRESALNESAKGQLLAMIWKANVEPARRPLLHLQRALKRKLKNQK